MGQLPKFNTETEDPSATNWTIIHLLSDPSWQDELYTELSRVLEGRAPTMADVKDLPKMEATIAESLRMCPASPLIVKANCETAKLRDYIIPANTMIMINVYHINRDPQVFPDPDTFNPRHWITEDGKFRGDLVDKTPTFGVGRRACLGRPLARMEVFLLLCRLMQTFAFTVPEGQPRPSGSMVGDSVVPGPPSYMLKLEIKA